MRARLKKLLSYLLVGAGAVLAFLGARDLFDSRAGQLEAARDFRTVSSLAAFGHQPKQGETLARLLIPRLSAEFYVMEGDGQAELRRGPGHMPGTAMPGAAGNCVIAGHRDTHFRVLKDIRRGDEIVIETSRGSFLYRVNNTRVVSPGNTAPLRPTSDAELNLITCFPFYYAGSAPNRFVVQAELAGLADAAPHQAF